MYQNLSSDKKILTLDNSFFNLGLHGIAHFPFIAVHQSTVNVSVSNVNRILHCLANLSCLWLINKSKFNSLIISKSQSGEDQMSKLSNIIFWFPTFQLHSLTFQVPSPSIGISFPSFNFFFGTTGHESFEDIISDWLTTESDFENLFVFLWLQDANYCRLTFVAGSMYSSPPPSKSTGLLILSRPMMNNWGATWDKLTLNLLCQIFIFLRSEERIMFCTR